MPRMREYVDICFAEVEGRKLLLDLFMPAGVDRPAVVVYIHGGAWRTGSHKQCTVKWLVECGYAVASVSYRPSSEALFPAQIHDCKGAVRWLRAHQSEYGYDASRMVAAGSSAGGHLALLLGMTAGMLWFEGNVGGNAGESSQVSGVVDFYGPTDFLWRSRTQPARTELAGGSVYQLLGGPVTGHEERARQASPVTHVTRDSPPVLIIHGTADQTVLMDQSQRMLDACRAHGVAAEMHVVPGGGHGGAGYDSEAVREAVIRFVAGVFDGGKGFIGF